MLVLRKKARSDGTELPDMEVIKSLGEKAMDSST
jgi:hypothetical protein